jgi:antitoxin CptB
MTPDTDTDAIRRKRLLWRATHRGIKEMDLIFGGFVQRRIGSLSGAELDEVEAMIALPDQKLLAWATKQEPVPPDVASQLLLDMLSFRP